MIEKKNEWNVTAIKKINGEKVQYLTVPSVVEILEGMGIKKWQYSCRHRLLQCFRSVGIRKTLSRCEVYWI